MFSSTPSSFEDGTRIRCVLIPLSGTLQTFEHYAGLLEACAARVDLCDVTRDPNDATL